MTKVLVTDGHSRAALQMVRSFGIMGLEVHVGETFSINPSSFSRYVTKSFVYPEPNNGVRFANFIHNYCNKNGIKFIFPVVDECLIAIVKNKKIFKNIQIPYSTLENLELFRDKLYTIRKCQELGLPHPKTFFSKKPNFKEIADVLNFPIIIKPRVSSGSRGIELIENFNEFESKFKIVEREYGTPLIQEFIPNGGACGTEMLYSSEGLVAEFSHYRIREYPSSGGPSTYRRPIKSNYLSTYSERLLSSVNWYGPAMVEFRIHKETKIPILMEVNGRYWGSLSCSIDSGVDFPKLHFLMCQGKTFPLPEYDTNLRSRWEIGDLLWLFSNGFSFVNFLSNFSKGLLSDNFDYLKKRDPMPFVIAFIEALTFLFSKKGRSYSMDRGWENP